MTNNLHAHVTTTATDCDGRYDRDYIMAMNADERASEFGDIEFHDRVATSIINVYAIGYSGRLNVENIGGTITLDWNESTDEGGRNNTARFCDEGCKMDSTSFRDHSAEAMNY